MTNKQAQAFRAEVIDINETVGTSLIHVSTSEFWGVSAALGLPVERVNGRDEFWVDDYCGERLVKIVRWGCE